MVNHPPLHVVAFGRPGSGKSSLAERLGEAHGFAMVRTGVLLRDAVRQGDALGRQVEALLAAGRLVPDDLAYEVLARDLSALRHNRLLFDGFPRTLGQVPLMARLEQAVGFEIERYVEIAVSPDEALARMGGRRVCPTCAATYHLRKSPPKAEGVCDRDGTPLVGRADDAPEVLGVRQAVYDEHTGPVVEHYRRTAPDRFVAIDGEQPFEEVSRDLERALGLS
ncbi:adenylate kinase family protein [Tautonia plasticadhaerens]|uniref:Adenylate kinase n=1 Tax=Tautonia plasticadhaerens TaxID=2527974 RepID=A0A518H586_9BACT|nr:nucleoside monophosphate kinase [Tautonia plasticadhaerens]QDV36001.1 Adenylate kinase [Tautonia plasticadhaerens]